MTRPAPVRSRARSGLGPAILHGDADQDILGRGLRVLDGHVEVSPVLEDSRLEQLELALLPAPSTVLVDKLGVWILGLRVLVEPFEVGVRWRGVEVEVVLLDVLAVIAFGARQAEVALLQDGVAPIPQGEGEAEALVVVGDAEDTVFTPAVGARAGVVVGEVVPGGAVRGVILSHCPPLPVGQIRAPAPPVGRPRARLLEPSLFCRHGSLAPSHRVAAQARRASATLQAWAGQPRGVKGASPSKISATLPTMKSLR